jgi:hypothetical protein
MPRLDVCDPSDCRVAFISRGQLQEVASVASDALWNCMPLRSRLVGTDNQQAVDGENQRARWSVVDLCALYRLGPEGVWRQSSLDQGARKQQKTKQS